MVNKKQQYKLLPQFLDCLFFRPKTNKNIIYFVFICFVLLIQGLPVAAQADPVSFVADLPVVDAYFPVSPPPPAYQAEGCVVSQPLDLYPNGVAGGSAQEMQDNVQAALSQYPDSNNNCILVADPPVQTCDFLPQDGQSYAYGACTVTYDMLMFDTGETRPQSSTYDASWSCPTNEVYSDETADCEPIYGRNDAQNNGDICPSATGGSDGSDVVSGTPGCNVGDPINPATGNLNESVIDFQGKGDFPLQVVRYFNSAPSTSAAPSEFLGIKWRLNYDRKLRPFPLGAGGLGLDVQRADGQILRFNQATLHAPWIAAANVNSKLTEQFDLAGNRTGWSYYTAENDSTEQYDAQGLLVWIQNRTGLRQTINRNTGTHHVQTVTDSAGRILGFDYDLQTGLLSSITLPGGGVLRYSYTPSQSQPGQWLFQTVQFPDNHSSTAIYNEPTHTNGATGDDFFTGTVDENGKRFQTFDYAGSSSPYSKWASGSSLGSGFGQTLISYPSSIPGPSEATVTAPNGGTRVFSYTNTLGALNPSFITQAATGATPQGFFISNYDTNGNVSQTLDFAGSQTCSQFDLTRNLEIGRVEGFPFGSTCPTDIQGYSVPSSPNNTTRKITTQWSPVWRLPTAIATPNKIETISYDSHGIASSVTDQATTDATGTLGFGATLIGAPRAWTIQTNSDGQITSMTGPRTDVAQTTTLSYYSSSTSTHAKGDLASKTNAAGQTTTYDSYDSVGRLLQSTDANGIATTISYTPRGWVSSITITNPTLASANGLTTNFDYDYVGNLTKTTFPDGSWVGQTFDDAHRLIGQNNSAGDTTTYTLDNAGNIVQTQVQDSGGVLRQQIAQSFNALGQAESTTGLPGEVTQMTYDAMSHPLTVTDALGGNGQYSYDALHRVSQFSQPGATPTSGNPTTTITQDQQGNLSAVADSRNLSTTFTTDGLGNTTTKTNPDSGANSSTYDVAGNSLTFTDARGKITTYSYDVLDRLIQATYQSGSPSVMVYDGGAAPEPYAKGQLTFFSDESGSTAFSYDAYESLSKMVQTTGSSLTPNLAQTTQWQFSYDSAPSARAQAGHLISIAQPGLSSAGSPTTVFYDYDSNGRVSGIHLNQPDGGAASVTIATNVSWSSTGQPQSWNWGNGSPYSRIFDLDGRLAQYPLGVLAGAGALSPTPGALSRTVSYDLAGRITGFSHADATGSSTALVAVAANQTFVNDGASQLSSFTPSPTAPSSILTESYGYDTAGNRNNFGVGANTYFFFVGFSNNALNNIFGGTPFTITALSYDAAGNMLSDGTNAWTFSDRGRMASSTNASAGSWRYFYNAQGLRTLKEGPNGQAVRYLRDQEGRLLGEYDQNGALIEQIVWLGDWPIAAFKKLSPQGRPEIDYVFSDQTHAPRAIVRDSDNAMLWSRIQSDPFGRVAPDENPQGQGPYAFDLRALGQIHDSETGLDHNEARDYSPALGRFTQPDPSGLAGGTNPYTYLNNSPLNNFDRDGQSASQVTEELDDCSLSGCGVNKGHTAAAFSSFNEQQGAAVSSTPPPPPSNQFSSGGFFGGAGGKATAGPQCKAPGTAPAATAPPVISPKITGKNYDSQNGQGVYVMKDANGVVRYPGRGDAPARDKKHAEDEEKIGLTMEVLFPNNVSSDAARGLEQRLIDQYGGIGGGQLINKYNSIRPGNPNRARYDAAATRVLEGLGIFGPSRP